MRVASSEDTVVLNIKSAKPKPQPETDEDGVLHLVASPFAPRAGNGMVIYIWKNKGWRRYQVQEA